MIPVIVNATSGPGHSESGLEDLRRRFEAAGVQVEVMPARDGAQLTELARKAMARSPQLVIVGGGDGTVSAVAQVTRGTHTALGILPLGTLNHFARDLKLPLALDEAITVALTGRRVAVDMAEVNGVAFLNNSSIGVYPDMVRDRKRQQRKLGRSKRMAMLWAILATVRRSPLLRMVLELDGKSHEFRAPFVFVGNNDYVMEGFQIGQRERLDAGKLSIYTTRRYTTIGLFKLAWHALTRQLHQDRDFMEMAARSLTVALRHKRILVSTDGEVTPMQTPLEYRILPGTLLVMAAQTEVTP